MTEIAAHLVDHVIPEVAIRQWVVSLPIQLRYILAFNAELCSAVLNVAVREIRRSYQWRGKYYLGLDTLKWLQTGAVTFIQRADSGLRLNLHLHSLFLDGVYLVEDYSSKPTFYALPDPSDEEVAEVAIAIRKKSLRMLERAGYDLGDADAFDDFADREPLLAACAAASATGAVITGPRAGQPVERLGTRTEIPRAQWTAPRCFNVDGFSLHANVRIGASDRAGLERLCRYVARPPIANHRLKWLDDGRVAYELKRPWSDGSTAMVFEQRELVAKLMPLIAPPWVNQVRYHGILAPAAAFREFVVPAVPRKKRKGRNYCWSDLMKRAFEFDVLVCRKCGGPMRVIASITDRETIRTILTAAGLPADSPPRAPAQPTRRDDLDPNSNGIPPDGDDWDAA